MNKAHRAVIRAISLIAVAAVGLTGCAQGSSPGGDASASGCGTYKLGVLNDDFQRVALWALQNGKVTSDLIDGVEVSFLEVPALIAATGTDQFTVSQTSVNAVPLARKNGLDVTIVYFGVRHHSYGQMTYVRKDSGIESTADLKGKTVAVLGLGSGGFLFAAKTYKDTYGLNPATDGGDIKWLELDPPTMHNALIDGHIDAAVAGAWGGYELSKDPEVKQLDDMPADWHELTGEWPVGAAYVAQTSVVEEQPECISEFQRLLTESEQYAIDNLDTVISDVVDQTGGDAEWLNFFFDGGYGYGGFDSEWIAEGQAVLDAAYEFGSLPEKADINDLVFTGGDVK